MCKTSDGGRPVTSCDLHQTCLEKCRVESSQSHHYLRHYRCHPYAVDVIGVTCHASRGCRFCRRGGEAGAAIVHLNARDPETGRPDQTTEAFARIASDIRRRSNVVINFTTGGAPWMKVEERVKPAQTLHPELASLNLGSMNLALYPMLERFGTELTGWEREHLENSRDNVFRNTFCDIEYVLAALRDAGTRFEFECYDIGHLYNLAHLRDRGLVRGPLFIQCVFGLLGGIGTHPDDVVHMKRTADRLFGDDFRWSVLGAGRHQMSLASMSVAMGGHIRVGLEDSLWIGPGVMARSNAQQVKNARKIVEAQGMVVASPDQARKILALDLAIEQFGC